MQESGYFFRTHDGQSVGLAAVARDLRHVLGGGDADGDREARGFEHGAAHRLAHRLRPAEELLASGHVDECLVEAQWLDERREVPEGPHDGLRDRLIAREPRREHDRVRASPPGDGHRHRAADSIRSGLVARGGYHAARSGPPDQQRLAAKLRPVELLDRREERVHVRVQDDARPAGGHDAGRAAVASGRADHAQRGVTGFHGHGFAASQRRTSASPPVSASTSESRIASPTCPPSAS